MRDPGPADRRFGRPLANVAAALDVAKRLGPDATVVTLACDSGLKYLSTDLYREP